jgi:hypothetical protein
MDAKTFYTYLRFGLPLYSALLFILYFVGAFSAETNIMVLLLIAFSGVVALYLMITSVAVSEFVEANSLVSATLYLITFIGAGTSLFPCILQIQLVDESTALVYLLCIVLSGFITALAIGHLMGKVFEEQLLNLKYDQITAKAVTMVNNLNYSQDIKDLLKALTAGGNVKWTVKKLDNVINALDELDTASTQISYAKTDLKKAIHNE